MILTLLKKLRDILPPSDRRKVIGLLFLMFVAAGFEVVGIGLIMTFISILSEPERIMGISWLAPVFSALSIDDSRDLLIAGSLILIGIFFIKNSYLVVFYYVQSNFIYRRFSSIAARLFDRYMNAPYVFHLRENTARLIRNVTVETTLLGHFVMLPILVIVMESVLVLSIVVFLIAVEPLNTFIVLFVIGGASGLFLRLIRARIQSFGQQSQRERADMIQRVNEGLGGIKEIMVKNRQSWFIEGFRSSVRSFAKAETYKEIFRQTSKPVVETVAVTGMLLVALSLVWQGRGVESILPVLTLFGVATFRLLPSIDKLIGSYNILRYYGYALGPIHEDIMNLGRDDQVVRRPPGSVVRTIALANQIELTHVRYSYPGSPEPVLRDLSLTIPKGAAVGFVGASGAGKTTIVDLVLGLLENYEGTITVDGTDIQEDLVGWQNAIGYIPQFIYLADTTIRKNIAFGFDEQEIDNAKVSNAVRMAQLEELIESLPNGLDTMVGERGARLSGGQRQRIGIARALYHNPEVLVMDEATSSLDNQTERYVIESIERLKKDRTIIIVAHRLTTVRNCDTLFLIQGGRVRAAGGYEELLKKSPEFTMMVQSSWEK